MFRIGISAFCSIILTCCLCPFVLSLTRKLKAGQPILGYVTNHYSKSGTPTMGGIAFLIGACSIGIVMNLGYSHYAVVTAVSALGFGIIGFLDDFIKIKRADNQGLKAYQKLIGQFGLGIILALFAYNDSGIGSELKIPFNDATIDLGVWAIPVYSLFVVGVVNFVNLTDGLDGLVSTTGSVYLIAVGIILFLSSLSNPVLSTEYAGLSSFVISFGGALAVFFVLNSFPAKIFMGDTGSLGVGALVALSVLFSKNLLVFFIIGAVYFISGLSVVIQVIWFKLTHKRVFKMAPFHHHLERCGIHENKIVAIYSLITLCGGLAVISFWG